MWGPAFSRTSLYETAGNSQMVKPHSQRRMVAAIAACWTLAVLGVAFDAAAAGPPLVDAVRRGSLNAVQAEIKRGADVNAAEPDGSTALHWAAYQNEADIAAALVRAGARVDAANR
jgi:hypothetical protein